MNIHSKIKVLMEKVWPGSATPDYFTAGKIFRFSTHPKKRHDKSGWVLVFHDQRGAVVGDYRTDFKTYVAADDERPPAAEMQRILADAKRQQEAEHLDLVASWSRSREQNRILWDGAEPVARRNAAGKYLTNRKVYFQGGNADAAMRYHASVAYFDGDALLGYFPALLAAITDVNGEMRSVHRTYLDALGVKANVPSPKKMTRGSGPIAGCSIKFTRARPIEGIRTIALAEGLETALAVFHLNGYPVEATVSASGMARYVWHHKVECLAICTDNDKNGVGQKAGNTLAIRAQQAGLDCRVLTPQTTGWDWADVWVDRLNKKGEAK